MFRRAHSNGHADSDVAAHPHSHDCTRADCETDSDACCCIYTDAGAYCHIPACADGNLGPHSHSHVCAHAHAATNPDRSGARG